LSRHADRQQLARDFGATDIVDARGKEAVEQVQNLTDGVGVDAALECVGTNEAMQTAIAISRAGAIVGNVGLPHGVDLPAGTLFARNIGVHGGPAPVRAYLPALLDDVLAGRINPGKVFDYRTDLDGIAAAYAAMDQRRSIKALIKL
jgi:threonine dehydrogenase-like Zn-dependent dehydrogenase